MFRQSSRRLAAAALIAGLALAGCASAVTQPATRPTASAQPATRPTASAQPTQAAAQPTTAAQPTESQPGEPTRAQASQVVSSFLAAFYEPTAPVYLAGNLTFQASPGQLLHALLGLPPQGWETFSVGDPLDRPSEVLFVPVTFISGAEHLHYEFTLVVERGEWKINGASLVRTDSPDEPGSMWRELLRADYTSDGLDETYYAMKTDVQAQASFNDDYLSANATTVGGLLVTQPGAHGPFTWLTVDRFGVHIGTKSLRTFAPGDEPAAFLLAFDPGSSYLISMLPLRADGGQHSEPLHINWYQHQGGFGLAPRPSDGGQPQEPAAQAPDYRAALNIGEVARRHLRQEFPDRPIVAGALAVAGDYAVASAVPAGMEWRTLFMRVAPGAGYEVVYDNIAATSEELLARGIPPILLQQSEAASVIGATMFHTNTPAYGGADGVITVDAIADGYARVTLLRGPNDELTIYLRDSGQSWEWLIDGQTFAPAQLDELGIPATLR
jgi:hypothetical protein